MTLSDVFDYDLYWRTCIITLYSLVLFRMSSSRLLGQYSSLDLIIVIMVGAVLGTAIVGGIPLIPSLISSALIISIHRILIKISTKFSWTKSFILGTKVIIIKDGRLLKSNLENYKLNIDDVLQSLRSQQGEMSIENVHRSYLEASGNISFIMK